MVARMMPTQSGGLQIKCASNMPAGLKAGGNDSETLLPCLMHRLIRSNCAWHLSDCQAAR